MIVSHVRLLVDVPETPPEIIERWKEGLKAQAERIAINRNKRIGDASAFIARMAGPAIKGWKNVLNPAYVSRKGLKASEINASFGANLSDAFKKYKGHLDYLFETVDGVSAKRFKDLVDRAAEDYGIGIATRLLPFTGYRASFLGLCGIACLWLTARSTTEGFLRGGDTVLEGGPYLICPATKQSGLKAMLNQRLIQAGATIVKSGLDAATIAAQNQLTAEQIQGFTDPSLDLIPFVGSGDSHVDYVVDNGILYLDIQVSKM